jgi:GAF domain-containing protein
VASLARVAVTKQLLHIADCTEDPSYKQGDDDFVAFVDLCGVRTLLDTPLLKKGELIGTIALIARRCAVSPINRLNL